MSVQNQVTEFVRKATAAMGLDLTVSVDKTPDGFRVDVDGPGAEALLWRRGEPIKALQHLVDAAFRRELGEARVHVDCLGYRRDKDAELKQMALHLVGKARSSGVPQEMGPLNPYERRIVHLAIAEDPGAASESIGDAFMKTVIISTTK